VTEQLLPVAILAGGLATRLFPVTRSMPKALVDVGGQPFIVQQLKLLSDNGVTRVVVCVGYLGEMIQEALGGCETQLGLKVEFSFDGLQLLGTAGALRQAAHLLGDAFFVLYGDSYLPCNYRRVQRGFFASGKQALMTVYRNDGRWDTSNVEFSEGRIRAYDKAAPVSTMRHIDYGLGVLSAGALSTVPMAQVFDLARLYQLLLEQGELAGYEVRERFYEIGSPDGLAEMRTLVTGQPDGQRQLA
jgi:MurNAc alpha-1-phosphate uridylyltransferase